MHLEITRYINLIGKTYSQEPEVLLMKKYTPSPHLVYFSRNVPKKIKNSQRHPLPPLNEFSYACNYKMVYIPIHMHIRYSFTNLSYETD